MNGALTKGEGGGRSLKKGGGPDGKLEYRLDKQTGYYTRSDPSNGRNGLGSIINWLQVDKIIYRRYKLGDLNLSLLLSKSLPSG